MPLNYKLFIKFSIDSGIMAKDIYISIVPDYQVFKLNVLFVMTRANPGIYITSLLKTGSFK